MIDELTKVPIPPSSATATVAGKERRLVWSVPFLDGPVDIGLLLFLMLLLDVKLAVKIPALAIACICQPRVSALWRIPRFYWIILPLTFIGWLLARAGAPPHYDVVAGAAFITWTMCLCAAWQVRVFSDTGDRATVARTLKVFFILNALVSLTQLCAIAWEIRDLNPYLYQGQYQKYFVRTGDYIHGISFDTSTLNALINAFGVIFFLNRKDGWMALCCMACLLATVSNFTNIVLLGALTLVYFAGRDREVRSGVILCMLLGALFLGKVSPQNLDYVNETFARWMHRDKPTGAPAAGDAEDLRRTVIARHYLDSLRALTVAGAPRSGAPAWTPKPEIPVPDINTAPYQSRPDTTGLQRAQIEFVASHPLQRASQPGLPASGHVPGKLLAYKDIFRYYRARPARIPFGAGPGNFSSRLAFRATGLGMDGSWPKKWTYIHPDFLHNHLDLYLAYFAKPKENHSLVHSPDSVFAQMWGEYGLIGLAAFLAYLAYFARRANRRTWPLLATMTAAFFVSYWFEQLSLVILFELMFYTESV